MPAEDASARYGTVAIAFHWVLALAILGSFSVGLYMADLPFSPTLNEPRIASARTQWNAIATVP